MTTQHSVLSTAAPLKGYVLATYTKYKGKRLGPYYSRTWKVRGKIKREYVKPSEVESVRAACQAYRDRRKRRTLVARDLHTRIGNIFWLNRMAKRLRKGDLRPEDYAFCEVIEKNGIVASGRPKLRTFNRFRPSEVPIPNTEYPIPSLQHPNTSPTQDFMYPSRTNSLEKFWKQTRQDFIEIKAQMLTKESEEEKWERWRKQHAQLPAPRPLPALAPPACISEQRLEEAVADLLRHVEGLEPQA